MCIRDRFWREQKITSLCNFMIYVILTHAHFWLKYRRISNTVNRVGFEPWTLNTELPFIYAVRAQKYPHDVTYLGGIIYKLLDSSAVEPSPDKEDVVSSNPTRYTVFEILVSDKNTCVSKLNHIIKCSTFVSEYLMLASKIQLIHSSYANMLVLPNIFNVIL